MMTTSGTRLVSEDAVHDAHSNMQFQANFFSDTRFSWVVPVLIAPQVWQIFNFLHKPTYVWIYNMSNTVVV
jgi:hypothetical protein